MAKLKPKFFLIGSVAEGTRLFRASEADLTVQFLGLHELTVVDATTLIVHERDIGLLGSFLKTHNVFDYPAFLSFFMENLQSAMATLTRVGKFPQSFDGLNLNHHQCKTCNKNMKEGEVSSIFTPMMHDENCHPAVCHTKLGACLILPWKFDNHHSWTMTVDFVPVFSVRGKTMDLFNEAIKSLVEKNPPGWRDYLTSIYKRDIILPEEFKSQAKSSNKRNIRQICIKILNYGNVDNCIIRPAQEMTVQDFQSNEILQQAYLHIKALNTVLGVGAKSYMVKKVLLLQDNKNLAVRGSVMSAEQKRILWQNLVFVVLNHKDLKKYFAKKIDYDRWKSDTSWNIPLI